jgi:hypothetical protein
MLRSIGMTICNIEILRLDSYGDFGMRENQAPTRRLLTRVRLLDSGKPSDARIGFEMASRVPNANRSGLHPDDEQQGTRL